MGHSNSFNVDVFSRYKHTPFPCGFGLLVHVKILVVIRFDVDWIGLDWFD